MNEQRPGPSSSHNLTHKNAMDVPENYDRLVQTYFEPRRFETVPIRNDKRWTIRMSSRIDPKHTYNFISDEILEMPLKVAGEIRISTKVHKFVCLGCKNMALVEDDFEDYPIPEFYLEAGSTELRVDPDRLVNAHHFCNVKIGKRTKNEEKSILVSYENSMPSKPPSFGKAILVTAKSKAIYMVHKSERSVGYQFVFKMNNSTSKYGHMFYCRECFNLRRKRPESGTIPSVLLVHGHIYKNDPEEMVEKHFCRRGEHGERDEEMEPDLEEESETIEETEQQEDSVEIVHKTKNYFKQDLNYELAPIKIDVNDEIRSITFKSSLLPDDYELTFVSGPEDWIKRNGVVTRRYVCKACRHAKSTLPEFRKCILPELNIEDETAKIRLEPEFTTNAPHFCDDDIVTLAKVEENIREARLKELRHYLGISKVTCYGPATFTNKKHGSLELVYLVREYEHYHLGFRLSSNKKVFICRGCFGDKDICARAIVVYGHVYGASFDDPNSHSPKCDFFKCASSYASTNKAQTLTVNGKPSVSTSCDFVPVSEPKSTTVGAKNTTPILNQTPKSGGKRILPAEEDGAGCSRDERIRSAKRTVEGHCSDSKRSNQKSIPKAQKEPEDPATTYSSSKAAKKKKNGHQVTEEPTKTEVKVINKGSELIEETSMFTKQVYYQPDQWTIAGTSIDVPSYDKMVPYKKRYNPETLHYDEIQAIRAVLSTHIIQGLNKFHSTSSKVMFLVDSLLEALDESSPNMASATIIRANFPAHYRWVFDHLTAMKLSEHQPSFMLCALGYDLLLYSHLQSANKAMECVQNSLKKFTSDMLEKYGKSAKMVICFVTIPELGIHKTTFEQFNQGARKMVEELAKNFIKSEIKVKIFDWAYHVKHAPQEEVATVSKRIDVLLNGAEFD